MARNLLYIVDPLHRLSPLTDTTLAIMEEAGARGFTNWACEIADIAIKDFALGFNCAPIHVPRGYAAPPVYLEAPRFRWAEEFAAVFMRKDPPVDHAFVTALLLLRQHDANKTVMINSPDGLLVANEKLFGLHIGHEFFPPTLVSANKNLILDFVNEHEAVVLKPLFASGGAGVMVTSARDRNLMAMLELLTANCSQPITVQAYIKNARAGDKRIMIVGGKPVGAIVRVPSEQDHRANFHAGGTPLAATLTTHDCEIVAALSPHLLALGLHVVGIDIIGGYLTEINVTSPTGVIEIERYSNEFHGRSVRALIVDHVETLLA